MSLTLMQKVVIQFSLSLKAKVNIVLIMHMHADFLYYFMSWIKEQIPNLKAEVSSHGQIYFYITLPGGIFLWAKRASLGLVGSVLINTKTYETLLDFT